MSASYDSAITVFSPDGHLLHVEYALAAVRKGSTAVAIVANGAIVIGVEKKSTAKLQVSQTVRKIVKLDHNLCLAFAGLSADARVLVNKARMECQSYRLSVEDQASVEYISRHIAQIQQSYTQKGGRRPFGLSTLVVGFNIDGTPALWQTEPSGTYSEWRACAIGKKDDDTRKYLEKHFDESKGLISEEAAVKLTVQTLLETVESGAKNIEVAVLRFNQELDFVSAEALERIEAVVVEEQEAAKRRAPAKVAEGAAPAVAAQ